MSELKGRGIESGCFLSYSGEHRDHAEFLKGEIEDACGVVVFAFTDPSSILPGEQWYEKVIASLKRAEATLLLLSPSSVSRPWIVFESGFALALHNRLVALRFGGLPTEFLPGVLKHFQSCDLTEKDAVVQTLDGLLSTRALGKARLTRAARSIVSYFKGVQEGGAEAGSTERALPSLTSRLALLAKLSDTQRRLFLHVRTCEYRGKGKKEGILESAIRERLPIPYEHEARRAWPLTHRRRGRGRETRDRVISASEYYYRLRELYHLGILEMEKVSEFENRWSLNSEVRQQLR